MGFPTADSVDVFMWNIITARGGYLMGINKSVARLSYGMLLCVASFLPILTCTAYGSIYYDAGSDVGKGGLPQDAGSIVDVGAGSHFWLYNNMGSTESLSGDYFSSDQPSSPSPHTNAYYRVFFEGTESENHPNCDLGFNQRDRDLKYSIQWRMRINDYSHVIGASVFGVDFNEGAEEVGNETAYWLATVHVKSIDGQEKLIAGISGGWNKIDYEIDDDWHNYDLEVDKKQPGEDYRTARLYVDGVLVGETINYWNGGSGDAGFFFGAPGSSLQGSADYDLDYMNVVPEPTITVIMVLSCVLSLYRYWKCSAW